jgi:hypothetical protein
LSKRKEIPQWLPDWTDESAYPSPDSDTLNGKIMWAWEFLRRNPKYQQAYNMYKQTPDAGEKMLFGLEIARNYGFRFKPVDPSRDNPFALTPAEISDLTPEEKTVLMHTFFNFSSPVRVLNNFSKLWGLMSSPVQSELITQGLGSNDIVIAFDVRLPAASQAEVARRYIEDLQELLQINPLEHKLHFGEFKNYLRILDAKLTGAVDDEIASKIYPRTSGQEDARQGTNAVLSAYKRAKDIRDKDYKYILTSASAL